MQLRRIVGFGLAAACSGSEGRPTDAATDGATAPVDPACGTAVYELTATMSERLPESFESPLSDVFGETITLRVEATGADVLHRTIDAQTHASYVSAAAFHLTLRSPDATAQAALLPMRDALIAQSGGWQFDHVLVVANHIDEPDFITAERTDNVDDAALRFVVSVSCFAEWGAYNASQFPTITTLTIASCELSLADLKAYRGGDPGGAFLYGDGPLTVAVGCPL